MSDGNEKEQPARKKPRSVATSTSPFLQPQVPSSSSSSHVTPSTNSTFSSASVQSLPDNKTIVVVQARERLESVCKLLTIDSITSGLASGMLEVMLQPGHACHDGIHTQTQSNQKSWVFCALFFALHTSGARDKPIVSLTHLLKSCDLPLTAPFCLQLSHFASHFSRELPAYFIERIHSIQLALLNSVGAYQKYEALFYKWIYPPSSEQESLALSSPTNSPEYVNLLFGCGWLLFLFAKAQLGLYGESATLHQMHVLLLCVIRLMIDTAHTSRSSSHSTPSRESQLDEHLANLCEQSPSSDPPSKAETSQAGYDAKLYDHVRSLQIDRFFVLLQELCDRKILSCAPGVASFSSILSPENLTSNVSALGVEYDKIVCNVILAPPLSTSSASMSEMGIWLDERYLIEARYAQKLSAPPLLTETPSGKLDIWRYPYTAFSVVFRHPTFPASASFVQPPRVIEEVAWLTLELRDAPVAPSPSVLEQLDRVSSDLAEKIARLASRLVSLISFPGPSRLLEFDSLGVKTEQKDTSFHRRNLAVKLFYRLLQGMIENENRRNTPQQTNTDTTSNSSSSSSSSSSLPRSPSPPTPSSHRWLLSDVFHTSLLACCFEIVIYAYKVRQLAFPKVLQAFKLKSWDFIKVIESVVRYGSGPSALPPTLKTHLRDIEQQVLLHQAWNRNDVLPTLISNPDGAAVLRSIVNKLLEKQRTAALSGQSKEVSTSKAAEIKETERKQSPPKAEEKSPETISTQERTTMDMFVRKVVNVILERLDYLAADSQLSIPPRLVELIFSLVLFILAEHSQVIIDRHVDTMVLCAVYGVYKLCQSCDINVAQITFNRVISAYLKRWPQNSVAVHEVPYLSDSTTTEGSAGARRHFKQNSIIQFYNTVLISRIKTYIMTVLRPKLAELHKQGVLLARSDLTSFAFTPSRSTPALHRVSDASKVYFAQMQPGPSILPPVSMSSRLDTRPNKPRVLYAFGESPSANLQEINKIVNTPIKKLSNHLAHHHSQQLPPPGGIISGQRVIDDPSVNGPIISSSSSSTKLDSPSPSPSKAKRVSSNPLPTPQPIVHVNNVEELSALSALTSLSGVAATPKPSLKQKR